MALKKTKVEFSDISALLQYSDKKVIVVYEEEVARNHTYEEVNQMHLQGAEFFLVEEDYSDLPEADKDPVAVEYAAKIARRGKTSNETIGKIGHMSCEGASVADIAKELDMSEKTVQRYVEKFENGELSLEDYE